MILSRTSARTAALSRKVLTLRAMSTEAPLQTQKCEPCTSSMPALSQDQALQLLSSLKGKWTLSPQPKTLLSSKLEHPDALHRTYKFKDYLTAQQFAASVADLAEREGHHPAVMVEWGRATVWWWSHAIKGLHRNDFVMAAKTEELAQAAPGYTPPKPQT